MKAKHTPIRISSDGLSILSNHGVKLLGDCNSEKLTEDDIMDFIIQTVACVNSHDAHVEALKLAINSLEAVRAMAFSNLDNPKIARDIAELEQALKQAE